MNFLMEGDALLIFCSASFVRDTVASEGALPCSCVVQMSWPCITLMSVRQEVDRHTHNAEHFGQRR